MARVARIPQRAVDEAMECLAWLHRWERVSTHMERDASSRSQAFRLYWRCDQCTSDKYTLHDLYGRTIGFGKIIPSLALIKAKEAAAVHRTDVDFTVKQQYRAIIFRQHKTKEKKATPNRRLKVVPS